jgi:alkyl hydroperoxide reductase subunit AhpC
MVEGGVPFHMVADQAVNVGRAYGVYDEQQGFELRGRFIIDPDGVIQAMEVPTPPVGRKFGETVRQIQAYQQVGASTLTEATPAGWEPGHAEAGSRPRGQRVEGLEPRHGEGGSLDELVHSPAAWLKASDEGLPHRMASSRRC